MASIRELSAESAALQRTVQALQAALSGHRKELSEQLAESVRR